jgi:hypothetical protein
MEKAGTIPHPSLIASTKINMKTYTKFSILLATIAAAFVAVLFTGCSTPSPVAPALVRTVVSTGVAVGLEQSPSARPAVQAAGTVVCAAASTTSVDPAALVLQLEAAGVNTNSEAVIIMNGVISLYDGIFQGYGSNWVASTPALETYLQAICAGVNDGLAIGTGGPGMRTKPLPAHMRKK